MKKSLSVIFLLLLSGCTLAPIPAPVEKIVVNEKPARIIQDEPELVVYRPDYHIVSIGETLTSIALNYGLEYRELARWNNLINPNLIKVNQKLRLNPPENDPIVTSVVPNQSLELKQVGSEKKGETDNSKIEESPQSINVTRYQAGQNGITVGESSPQSEANDAPIKTGPLATKFLYSERFLKNLRNKQKETASDQAIVEQSNISADETAPVIVRQRFSVDWSWPTKHPVTQYFNKTNNGIRFLGKVGDIVFSCAQGKVVYVGTGVKTYGKLVIIKHDNDYLSAYAHNSQIFVKEGDWVDRGSKIALFGNSGVDKIMLHFEIRKAGKPVDPLQVLPKIQ